MIKQRVTRRQFFQMSAFGAAAVVGLPAIGLASVAAAPTQEAQAAAEQPLAPSLPQPTFNPIASNTTFGMLTDISMGWDGTLWGIDGQGAPHIFDPINNLWAQHGDRIDAAALDGQLQGTIYVFQGPNVVPINATTLTASAPTTIAALWPTLPQSFKLGVSGAMMSYNGTGVLLFNAGRYIATDGSIPLGKLTDLPGWPQTPTWKDGVIDAAFNTITPGGQILLRAGEVLSIRIIDSEKRVIGSPVAFADFVKDFDAPLPADWVNSGGVDAWCLTAGTVNLVFKGTTVVSFDIQSPLPYAATIKYIGNMFTHWPAVWHPVLQHAPNGRDGNLWSVLPQSQGGWVLQHNGDSWVQLPNQADHVGVGQDGTVMLASAQRLWKFTGAYDGTGFTPLTPPSNLIQVSLGNANAVFARDSAGNVFSFDPTSNVLTQNTDVGTVSHIATSNDGTLWHAKPNSANVHRQLVGSGIAPEAIDVKQNLLASVSKVAATGFGASHCLAQDGSGNTQAFRYDSPYVFKTAKQYNVFYSSPTWIEQGAGLLFVTDNVPVQTPIGPQTKTEIAALDAHTGVEVARLPQLPDYINYGQPVFDPINNLVYVGTATEGDADMTTPGQLLALDPRTLAVKWSFTTPTGIDAPPSLNGTRLCVSDRTGKLHMFDTTAAAANPANVQPRWTATLGTQTADTYRIAPPAFVGDVEDLIYTVVWAATSTGSGHWNVTGQWVSYRVADGSQNDRYGLHESDGILILEPLLTMPAVGKLNIGTVNQPKYSSALFYNCDDHVIAIGAGPTAKFIMLSGDHVNTGFTYDKDTDELWFGTRNGALYCLDANLSPINHTPFYGGPDATSTVYTTPVIYKDGQGGTTILFNVLDPGAVDQPYYLKAFDPDNGNDVDLPTGVTRISSLSLSTTNGVVYAAGYIYDFSATSDQYPQIFAIRVDDVPQAERDFIIESQLMQDPDQNASGSGSSDANNPIPPSVARYQTHLTVVDDEKNPRAREQLKVWADIDGTVINVDGKQYTIGPADNAYAVVQTGVDGCVVITSDATNTNASALRVWATFMDPYERMVVYPDHEWHDRSASVYNDPNADPTHPDPTKPNLSTAHTYTTDTATNAPKQLFTDDEKNQGTPGNVANAVGQMKSGLNPGGNNPASVAGALKTMHASNSLAKYVAYTDLGGLHYGPNNARAKRTATVAAPFGFVLNKPQGGAHTYTPLSHSDARNAIDALEGDTWVNPNPPSNGSANAGAEKDGTPVVYVIGRSDDIFSDFWNWLVDQIKKAITAIENVIVSVADDIMVGINFIINGVKQVFRAIIKVIEDVCNAIGSFFVQLIKAIEDMIEALSVLFHFGEIMKTHRWIANQVNQRVTDLTNAISGTIIPKIDGFFALGEEEVKGFFDSLRSEFSTSGNPQLNNTRGYGQTPHSAFTITPRGGTPSSQETQCTWGTQNAKNGMPGASVGGTLMRALADSVSPNVSTDDPVSDFFTGFIQSLTTDPTLNAATSQLKNDFGNLVKANSVSDFFSQLMTALLDLIETLVLSALVVADKLIDGLAKVVQQAITAVLDIMNAEIVIQPITWLYELLFQEKLTLLNVITLVSAIPITIIFRLVEGQYPSQAGLGALAEAQAASPAMAQVAPKPALMVIGIFVGICQLVQGVANCFSDAAGAGDAPAVFSYVSIVAGMLIEVFSFPLIGNESADVSDTDWAVYGIGAFATIMLLAGVPYTKTDGTPNDPLSTQQMSFISLVLYLAILSASIAAYVKDDKSDGISNAGFAEEIISSIVGMLNPVKLTGGEAPAIVAAFDALGGVIEFFITLFTSIISNASPAPSAHRLHFPFVTFNPLPARAAPQPLAVGGATP